MAVRLRTASPDDLGFVLKTWTDSYRDSKTSGIIPMGEWSSTMSRVVKGILSRGGVSLFVACNPDAADGLDIDLHGWIAVERDFKFMASVFSRRYQRWEHKLVPSEDRPLVHYCYVKPMYRRHGVARALFRHAEVDPLYPFFYSCSTVDSGRLTGKMPGGEWNPKICRFRKKQQKEQRT